MEPTSADRQNCC